MRRRPSLAVLFAVPALALTGGCLEGDLESGRSTFAYQCAYCHGADGSGGIEIGGQDTAGQQEPTVSPDLRERVPQLTDQRLLQLLREGKGRMPSQYSEDDDAALDMVVYLRDAFDG